MAIQMKDVFDYEPAPGGEVAPEINMNVLGGKGSRFKGDPEQLQGFITKMQDLWNSSEARKREKVQENDITQVDPEKFRKNLQARIGGDYRVINLYDEATKLYQARLPGLRSHVFGGRIPQKATAEQQAFFANQAAKLWQVCAMEAKADRDTMMQKETAGMDELDRRIAQAKSKAQAVAQERKRGIDLRKLYTGESIKEYQRTGDVSVLKKERELMKPMSGHERADIWLKTKQSMEDWIPPFDKDEEGNFVLNGKPVTDKQMDQARRAEMERRFQNATSAGFRLADVTGGKPKAAGSPDIRNIFPDEKKKPKGKEKIVGTVEGGESIIIQKADGTFKLGKPSEMDTGKKPEKNKETKKLAKPVERLTVREFLKEMAEESGEEKVRKFTNSLSKEYGDTKLVDKKFLKQLKKAWKETKMLAGFYSDVHLDYWIRLGNKMLDLPVPGTRKS